MQGYFSKVKLDNPCFTSSSTN